MTFMVNPFVLFGQQVFSPADLFALGEDGGWYDPSDLSTLWQDTAATTPVTTSGQSVARIDDKSGNGHHLIQSVSGDRPLYQESGGLRWLDFDGVSDYIEESSFTSSISDSGGALAASCSSDDAEKIGGVLQELVQGSGGDTGRVVIYFDTRSTPRRHSNYAPDSDSGSVDRTIDLDSEIDVSAKVFIFSSDGFTGEGYVDNVQQGASVSTTAVFPSTTKISIGRQTAGPAYHNGKVYGAIILSRGLTSTERLNLNNWLADKAGI